eukprot:3011965-Rhodomonas_salina.10
MSVPDILHRLPRTILSVRVASSPAGSDSARCYGVVPDAQNNVIGMLLPALTLPGSSVTLHPKR